MKKNFPLVLFVILIFGVVTAFFLGSNKKGMSVSKSKADVQKSETSSDVSADFPLSVNSQSVTSAYVHYYLTGTISEVKNDGGYEIILDSSETNLPALIIGERTRISRITPPYSESTSQLMAASDLKEGLVVDISIEYDLRNKNWNILDVFVPTDKNP
jgi:hypothetical protein